MLWNRSRPSHEQRAQAGKVPPPRPLRRRVTSRIGVVVVVLASVLAGLANSSSIASKASTPMAMAVAPRTSTPEPSAPPEVAIAPVPIPSIGPAATPAPVPSLAPAADPIPTRAPTPVHPPGRTVATSKPPRHGQPPVFCGSLQSRIDVAPAGSTVRLGGCTYAGGATIDKPLTLVGGLLKVRSGGLGLKVSANNVTIEQTRIVGPNGTSFNRAEYGIYALGSAGSPIRHLTIRNVDIGSFGDDGIYAKYVANLIVSGSTIHDIVYAGVLVISGQAGQIQSNLIERIGVHGAAANSNNAYGVALTDQGGSPTSDIVVRSNTVEDVPTWHALDTHGGQRISFINNTVRRSSRAIFITISPSSRATDVTVSGNQLLTPVAYNLEAVTTYDTVAVTITGNTITGWGGAAIEDYQGRSSRLVVNHNRVR